MFAFEFVDFAEGPLCCFFVFIYGGIPPWFITTAILSITYGGFGGINYNIGNLCGLIIDGGWSVFGILFEVLVEFICVMFPLSVG